MRAYIWAVHYSAWHIVLKYWTLLYYYFPTFLHKLDRNQDVGEWWNGHKAPVRDIKINNVNQQLKNKIKIKGYQELF